jgi:hypothetical protein
MEWSMSETDKNGVVVQGRIYLRNFLAHAEYDKDTWKKGFEY